MGAATLCMVDRFDTLTVSEMISQYGNDSNSSFVHKLFTPRQWNWIESFFECSDYFSSRGEKAKPHLTQYWDRASLLSDEERMKRIFTHVAKHGDFIIKKYLQEYPISKLPK